VSALVLSDGLVALVGGRFEDDDAAPFRFLPSFFSFGVVVVLVLRCLIERVKRTKSEQRELVHIDSSWDSGSRKYLNRTYLD
jgi:hypothetical protein